MVSQSIGQNVGINTSNPTEPLEVGGMIYSSLDGFKFPDGTVQSRAATNFPSSDAGDTRELFLMEIDQIQGPFSYQNFNDCVHLLDVVWNVGRPQGGGMGGGGGSSAVEGDSIIFLKDRDKATVRLLDKLFQGHFIAEAHIHFFREDTIQQTIVDYYRMELTHVTVGSVKQFTVYAGDGGYRHLEEIVFRFREIDIRYEFRGPAINTQFNFETQRD
jgi:type VI secretion system Hcp family effector